MIAADRPGRQGGDSCASDRAMAESHRGHAASPGKLLGVAVGRIPSRFLRISKGYSALRRHFINNKVGPVFICAAAQSQGLGLRVRKAAKPPTVA